MLDPGIPVPAHGPDVLATRRRVRLADVDRARPRPARRAGSVPPGRRDRRRPGDRLGNARRTSGSCGGSGSTSLEPFLRTRRSSSSPGAAGWRRSRPDGAGRSRATAAGAPRSTASGSISIPTSGRPGSRASASTVRPPAAGGSRRSWSCPIRRAGDAGLPWPLRATRHRPPRPRQQRRLLAGGRARARRRPASTRRGRSSPSSTTASRSTSATRSSWSRRATGGELLAGFRAADGIRAVARVSRSIASPQAAPFASL